jgi:hypothetical protein
MLSGHRPARRRPGNRRAARIAAPLAVPMALGLTLGIVLAVSGGNSTRIDQSALGASARPPGRAPAAAPPARTAASDHVNCDIIVPADPLSARGLSTPYQLTGPNGTSPADSGCTMANAAALGAFVQATVIDPRTGALSVYNPLVITQGTTPSVAPAVPKLPRNAVVTIDFGFNGTNLIQRGATADALAQGHCVNGLRSPFGQVSFCNGISFFRTAFALMGTGRLRIPSEGTSAAIVPTGGRIGTGRACPDVRDFDVVDQDQSDNVTSAYLLDPATGRTAQDTAANEASLAGARKLTNGSDNALVDDFMDPALGCTPFLAPDLANGNTPATSQALDELLAAAPANAPRVAALVPANDEMVLDARGHLDPAKTNLYRAEVGQPAISAQNNPNDSPAAYCQNLINIQGPFLAANQDILAAAPTPVADVGDNLYTFLARRLSMSFANLGCPAYGLTDPVTVTLDGNGAAAAATVNTTPQQAASVGSPQSWPRLWRQWLSHHARQGRADHRLMDPSGM